MSEYDYELGREDEREYIVEWLRSKEYVHMAADAGDMWARHQLSLADDIESGEHLKEHGSD